jgi:hypothetical protein
MGKRPVDTFLAACLASRSYLRLKVLVRPLPDLSRFTFVALVGDLEYIGKVGLLRWSPALALLLNDTPNGYASVPFRSRVSRRYGSLFWMKNWTGGTYYVARGMGRFVVLSMPQIHCLLSCSSPRARGLDYLAVLGAL